MIIEIIIIVIGISFSLVIKDMYSAFKNNLKRKYYRNKELNKNQRVLKFILRLLGVIKKKTLRDKSGVVIGR